MSETQRVSNLFRIKLLLGQRKDIIIEEVRDKNLLPDNQDGEVCHDVDIFIAPKTSILTASKLQKFMIGLIPDIEPAYIEDFTSNGHEMRFGFLCFHEVVGVRSIVTGIVLDDPDLIRTTPNCNEKGEIVIKHKTMELKRRICVRLFPHTVLAYQATREINFDRIELRYLKSYDSRAKQLAIKAISGTRPGQRLLPG